jgi:hypothetical protein
MHGRGSKLRFVRLTLALFGRSIAGFSGRKRKMQLVLNQKDIEKALTDALEQHNLSGMEGSVNWMRWEHNSDEGSRYAVLIIDLNM